jgi:CheY-like chemotaxis protein
MRILLMDDEISFIDNLLLYLEDRGHTVDFLTWVKDENHLREHLERVQPDGVILDFGMEPQGDQLYRWIHRWNPATRIVFYTSYARSPEKRRIMEEAGRDLHSEAVQIVHKQEVGSDVSTLLHALRI